MSQFLLADDTPFHHIKATSDEWLDTWLHSVNIANDRRKHSLIGRIYLFFGIKNRLLFGGMSFSSVWEVLLFPEVDSPRKRVYLCPFK